MSTTLVRVSKKTVSCTPKSTFLHTLLQLCGVEVIICWFAFRLCLMFGAWWTLHPHLPKWIWQVCYCFPVFCPCHHSVTVWSLLSAKLTWVCLCPGRFWLCHGWSWVGNATSPAPSRATVLTLCSTPNPSMEERNTGSPLRFCKKIMVAQHN